MTEAERQIVDAVRKVLVDTESSLGGTAQVAAIVKALEAHARSAEQVGLYVRAAQFFDAADAIKAQIGWKAPRPST